MLSKMGQLAPLRAGRLVTLRGTVTRVAPIKPLVKSLKFTCGKCEEVGALYKLNRFDPP